MTTQNDNALERLRNILDNMGCRHMKKDGAIYTRFSDENNSNPTMCLFTASDSKIQASAWQEELSYDEERRGESLEFCNQWNYSRVNPRAYLDEDGDLRVDMALFEAEKLSDEYLEENFIGLFVSTARQFYEEAAKRFA